MGPRTTSSGQKIEARNLTKRYGTTLAVEDLSFDELNRQFFELGRTDQDPML